MRWAVLLLSGCTLIEGFGSLQPASSVVDMTPADLTPLAPFGAACTRAEDCDTGFCAALIGGYCTRECTANNGCAGLGGSAGATCIQPNMAFPNKFCLQNCPDASSCSRAAYGCCNNGPVAANGQCAPVGSDYCK
jgi:hypothetical protein